MPLIVIKLVLIDEHMNFEIADLIFLAVKNLLAPCHMLLCSYEFR